MNLDMPLIDISIQPIELCKLLKIANMVGGGGEAKIVISEGYVVVNNEVELQKRKKIYHGDIVEFNGEIIQVNVTEEITKPITPSIPNSKVKQKHNKKNTTKSPTTVTASRSKRKPISF